MAGRLILLLCLFCFSIAVAQINDSKIRERVLQQNEIGENFTFGKWNESGETQTDLKYLGYVKTMQGKIFKVLTFAWHWGTAHHATSKILIYNDENQYVGEYNVGAVYDLPDELKDGQLIFYHTNSDSCDKNLHTKIDLKKGLPVKFFLKCKEKYGDVYHFSSQ